MSKKLKIIKFKTDVELPYTDDGELWFPAGKLKYLLPYFKHGDKATIEIVEMSRKEWEEFKREDSE